MPNLLGDRAHYRPQRAHHRFEQASEAGGGGVRRSAAHLSGTRAEAQQEQERHVTVQQSEQCCGHGVLRDAAEDVRREDPLVRRHLGRDEQCGDRREPPVARELCLGRAAAYNLVHDLAQRRSVACGRCRARHGVEQAEGRT